MGWVLATMGAVLALTVFVPIWHALMNRTQLGALLYVWWLNTVRPVWRRR